LIAYTFSFGLTEIYEMDDIDFYFWYDQAREIQEQKRASIEGV